MFILRRWLNGAVGAGRGLGPYVQEGWKECG